MPGVLMKTGDLSTELHLGRKLSEHEGRDAVMDGPTTAEGSWKHREPGGGVDRASFTARRGTQAADTSGRGLWALELGDVGVRDHSSRPRSAAEGMGRGREGQRCPRTALPSS